MRNNSKAYILIEIIIAIVLISIFGNIIIRLVNSNLKNSHRLKAKAQLEEVDRNFIELLYLDKGEEVDYRGIKLGEIFNEFSSQARARQSIELEENTIILEKTNREDDLWEINYEIKNKKYGDIFVRGRIFTQAK